MKKFSLSIPFLFAIALLAAMFLAGRSNKTGQFPAANNSPSITDAEVALAIVLTPPKGDSPGDREISDLQNKIKSATNPNALLERLGWAYVNKARLTSDPGFYKVAEKCADAMASASGTSPAEQLLRGHVYHAMHRFKDAENIARKLVSAREFVLDFALLGDVLMEQGRLTEAVEAYQKMVDLKPCLQTYSRVAHMRWLKGDLPGAVEIMRLAIASGSPKEPEPVAWACTQLARYEMQLGQTQLASGAIESALQSVPEYRAALFLKGRLLLAEGNYHGAVALLRSAAADNPLPEYLWALADALRADNDTSSAEKIEEQIRATGAANDPRSLSLFLASRALDPSLALSLARAELEVRQDVFTLDALAWAELANGSNDEARKDIELALAEGTRDARLFYHAGAIFTATGETAKGLDFLHRAKELSATLLPSERDRLGQQLAAIGSTNMTLSSN